MSIKYAILGLLHYQDMHGYEIKNRIEKNFAHTWTVNYGQIYTSLKALLKEGDIVLSEVVPSAEGAPPKKLYSLTEKGREEFKAWLGRPPKKKRLHRDPFLMRFIFFGLGEEENAIRLIDEQIRIHEQQLAQRKEEMPQGDARGPFIQMARKLGMTYTELRLQWLHEARRMVLSSKEDKDSKTKPTRRKQPNTTKP